MLAGCVSRPAVEKGTVVGMANPASVHCEKQGGRSETWMDAKGNQAGYCRFPDGRLCEEWAFFREGICRPPGKDLKPLR